jgi:hypothetical protein
MCPPPKKKKTGVVTEKDEVSESNNVLAGE